ncbi:MAG: metallopeptidase family protein [Candidatus Paceibacterota bacterium]|jgi:predicted Zn-dependent protease with MMP-like domain
MEMAKFEKLVEDGIKEIPQKFLEKLDNVAIVIEEEPSLSQMRKFRIGKRLALFGLYEGIPRDKRENYAQVLPDKITIFKKPIEEFVRSEKDVKRIVSETVWHEIAHHFGMDEKMVREAERRRKLGKADRP